MSSKKDIDYHVSTTLKPVTIIPSTVVGGTSVSLPRINPLVTSKDLLGPAPATVIQPRLVITAAKPLLPAITKAPTITLATSVVKPPRTAGETDEGIMRDWPEFSRIDKVPLTGPWRYVTMYKPSATGN